MSGVLFDSFFPRIFRICPLFSFDRLCMALFISAFGYDLFSRLYLSIAACFKKELVVEQFLTCLRSWDFGIFFVIAGGWQENASKY